jgi:hypothetical protein
MNYKESVKMVYQSHEIIGTDKPIYNTKQEGFLFYEEILLLNENPGDYQIEGYLQVNKGQILFQPLYTKRG